DWLTSIKDSFTSIKDWLTSIKDSFTSIKDWLTSIKDSFTSIKDWLASIKDSSPILNAPCPLALSVRVASRREAEGMPNSQRL
ncbi:MAG: hypothetical protein V7L20_06875, partial [Nostoc sp.]|uniref:hypothetical protein n=1 Tax=Nostoc sp. TaxID=1180 RepID=UPI002FF6C4FF